MKKTWAAWLVFAVMAMAKPAVAQHFDMHLEVQDGKIAIEDEVGHEALFDGMTGFRIIEGDFGDFAGGPFATANPGFAAHAGAFAGGAILGYRTLGSLEYWNGTSWTLSTPGQEQVRIVDALEQHSIYSAAGLSGTLIGAIGQTGSDGSLHEHIDFLIDNAAGVGDPGVGAYLITFSILGLDMNLNPSADYIESNPIHLLFNRGLSAIDFELAVDARVAEVPLPAAGPLMAGALALAATFARRRKAAMAS